MDALLGQTGVRTDARRLRLLLPAPIQLRPARKQGEHGIVPLTTARCRGQRLLPLVLIRPLLVLKLGEHGIVPLTTARCRGQRLLHRVPTRLPLALKRGERGMERLVICRVEEGLSSG